MSEPSGGCVIWKFTLMPPGLVDLPADAEALSVQTVDNQPVLYAMVDPTAPMVTRSFGIYGTGQDVPADPGRFLGTVQMYALHETRTYVFHIFDTQSGRWWPLSACPEPIECERRGPCPYCSAAHLGRPQ